jgi:succinate dehydrogenase / fumarate reductase, cytochrome b subunit
MATTLRRPAAASVRADKMVYKGKSGQWAFVLHRVTGFLLFMYLLQHIVDVSLINIDADLYDEIHELYGNVLLRLFEVGLLFALLFHAFNGVRIVTLDFFPGMVKNERSMYAVVVALTFAAGIPGAYVILEPFISGTLF